MKPKRYNRNRPGHAQPPTSGWMQAKQLPPTGEQGSFFRLTSSLIGFLGGLLSSSARLRFTDRDQNALKWSCRSRISQRTANMVLTGCVSQGDNRTGPARAEPVLAEREENDVRDQNRSGTEAMKSGERSDTDTENWSLESFVSSRLHPGAKCLRHHIGNWYPHINQVRRASMP